MNSLSHLRFRFYIGIEGEANFSVVGTVAGVVSSVFVSLNSIYTAKVLPKVQDDKALLLYYNNINACMLFVPLVVILEWEVSFEISVFVVVFTYVWHM